MVSGFTFKTPITYCIKTGEGGRQMNRRPLKFMLYVIAWYQCTPPTIFLEKKWFSTTETILKVGWISNSTWVSHGVDFELSKCLPRMPLKVSKEQETEHWCLLKSPPLTMLTLPSMRNSQTSYKDDPCSEKLRLKVG